MKPLCWSAEARLLQRLLDGPATTSEVTLLARQLGVNAHCMAANLARQLRKDGSHLRVRARHTHVPTKFGRTEQWIYELERVA